MTTGVTTQTYYRTEVQASSLCSLFATPIK